MPRVFRFANGGRSPLLDNMISVKAMSHGLLLLLAVAGAARGLADTRIGNGGSWDKVSSTHFIVMHRGDEKLAQMVSERAEAYYGEIAADLGYTRYQNFWVWDKRVKILIYPTAEEFATACKAPAWAAGRASADRREIASYRQSGESFLGTLLPHEMSHLILGDFVGHDRVPLWLTEGFAQWEQSRHADSPAVSPGHPVPLKILMAMDIRKDRDPQRVALFYHQAASVVGYLIRIHGGERFGLFCRGLRDGKSCEAALAAAYPDDFPSLEALEQKWLETLIP